MANSKDRVLGQNVTLSLTNSTGGVIAVAEIDSASVTDKTKMNEHQPLGSSSPRPQLAPGGYEVQCKVGKVDDSLSTVINARDQILRDGTDTAPIQANLTIVTTFYDGTVETAVYTDGVIYNYKYDATKADSEVTEEFTFVCAYRVLQ